MICAETYEGRFLLLIAPQLLASAVAITVFVVEFILPVDLILLHLLTIGAIECIFFLACGWLARWAPIARNRIAPYAYVSALFGKFLAIDLLYIASFGTHLAWGDNLAPANLRVVLPHVEGFRQAYGLWVFGAAAGLLLLLLGGYLTLLRFARRLFRGLLSAFPDGGAAWTQPAFTGLVCLVAVASWKFGYSPIEWVRTDPVFSFWCNNSLLTPTVIADLDEPKNYPQGIRFERRNVIVMTVDSLRADHLSLYGYPRETAPFLSSLAKAARLVKVPFAVSAGNESQQGVFAVFSSRHVNGQHPANFKLYDVLKQLGYRTYLIAAGDHTHFREMRSLYGKNLDVFADGLTPGRFSVNDDRGILEKLEQVRPFDGEAAFFFFHLMSCHTLGVRDPQFSVWHAAKTHRGGASEAEIDRKTATYDNGVRQADDFVRRVFATLERKGYLNDYIAVITGDHGEGLGEHGSWGHTHTLFGEDIDVPILLLGSDALPEVPASFASQIDIAPTILHELGLPIPATWEGYAFGTAPERREVFLTSKRIPGWRGVIRAEKNHLYKYLFAGAAPGEAPEYLFDLVTDPHERNDLIGSAPSTLLNDLRRVASRHFQLPSAAP